MELITAIQSLSLDGLMRTVEGLRFLSDPTSEQERVYTLATDELHKRLHVGKYRRTGKAQA